MLDLLLEGVESLRLPCSWVILLPALALTLYARHRNALTIGVFVAVASLVAWLRFAGWWFAAPDGSGQVALGSMVGLLAVTAWRLDRPPADAAIAGAAAIAAVSSWIPCVGPNLGALLNESRSAPWSHLGGTVAYMVGLSLPFLLVPAGGALWPDLDTRLRDRRVILAGAMTLLLFAGLLVTTLLDDVSSELARRSSF